MRTSLPVPLHKLGAPTQHVLRTAATQANESPEDAYDALKAANDLRAQDEHQALVKALRERAEAMLMSNVI